MIELASKVRETVLVFGFWSGLLQRFLAEANVDPVYMLYLGHERTN